MEILETKRLLLRKPNRNDRYDFYEYAQSELVGPNAGWPPVVDLLDARARLRAIIRYRDTWAIQERNSGKMIGTIALHTDKRRNHQKAREVGFSISPDFWGRGYMPEAVNAVLDYGFSRLGLLLVSADHYPFNNRSKRVLEKCGFQFEGVLRKSWQMYDGAIYDYFCYSITREEFFAKQRGAST